MASFASFMFIYFKLKVTGSVTLQMLSMLDKGFAILRLNAPQDSVTVLRCCINSNRPCDLVAEQRGYIRFLNCGKKYTHMFKKASSPNFSGTPLRLRLTFTQEAALKTVSA